MWFFSSHRAQPKTLARPRRHVYRPCLEALEDRCLPSSSPLDPTFGTGGIVTTSVSNAENGAHAVLIQPDGKVVAVGYWHTSEKNRSLYGGLAVVRYTASGGLDPTFGSGGVVTSNFGGLSGGTDAALQSDGKIVVVGGDGLARFLPNGTLDSTFGGGRVNASLSYISGVAIQPTDGKIVVAGYALVKQGGVTSREWGLERYNSTGSLDKTFGSSGKVITHISVGISGIYDIVIQPDGKLDVAGYGNDSSAYGGKFIFTLGRYNANGSLDSTFGTGGIVTTFITPQGDIALALALQADGKIVAVGTGDHGGSVARYNPNGSLDTTFGSGGVVNIPKSGDLHAVAIQPWDGKIDVAGVGSGAFLARCNLDGSLDTTFNGTGTVRTALPPDNANGVGSADLAIYPRTGTANDGKIVMVGETQYNFGSSYAFFAARYVSGTPQIASFTASPDPVTAGSSVTLTASNITDSYNPNSTITQVAFYVDANGDGKLDPSTDTLVGYGTYSGGTWTFTSSTAEWLSGSYTLFAQAQDSYNAFSDPLALTLLVV